MAKILHRHAVRVQTDRVTNMISLQYVGRGLRWIDRLYGFPEGTFFVAMPNEIPLPEEMERLAIECGVDLVTHPAAAALRLAVADALVAEALVNAPSLLAQISEPDVAWGRADEREVERRHVIALSRVSALNRQLEVDLKLRRDMRASPGVIPVLAQPVVAPAAADCPSCLEPGLVEPPMVASSAPPSAAVRRAQEATRRARENELPQRLPEGARRALGKMERGVYAITDGAFDRKGDLCSAMSEAQEMSRRREQEVVVVDWDGEWPVVVRRYGEGGRIIYRVEDALRRAGIEEEAA
jgi:hypothetical protein